MRVITGKARACRLQTLDCYDVRPTTDKVKEAVFSTIQFLVQGGKFLDLFAGSGQIGIEALSRDASSCTFVEKDIRAIKIIKNNLEHSKLQSNSNVVNCDVVNFLSKNAEKFDIIYLDPPYNSGKLTVDVLELCMKNAVKPSTVLLCEHSDRELLPDSIGLFSKFKVYKYGKVRVSRYENCQRGNLT